MCLKKRLNKTLCALEALVTFKPKPPCLEGFWSGGVSLKFSLNRTLLASGELVVTDGFWSIGSGLKMPTVGSCTAATEKCSESQSLQKDLYSNLVPQIFQIAFGVYTEAATRILEKIGHQI